MSVKLESRLNSAAEFPLFQSVLEPSSDIDKRSKNLDHLSVMTKAFKLGFQLELILAPETLLFQNHASVPKELRVIFNGNFERKIYST